MQNKKILAVDLGSYSARAAVANIDDERNLFIESIKEVPTQGIHQGVIVNLSDVQNTLKNLLHELSYDVDSVPKNAVVNVGGTDIAFVRGTGLYSSTQDKNIISQSDINKAVESGRNCIQLPYGRYIIHSLVEEFVVNNTPKIKNPLNLPGNRIEAKVMLLTALDERKETFKLAFEKSGLKISDFYFSTLACSSVVLNDEQKQNGAIIIDIGNDESSIISFQQGKISFAGGVPFGSAHLSADLQYIIQKSRKDADYIKEEFGVCYLPLVNKEMMIELKSSGTAEKMRIPQSEIAQIFSARAVEIFTLLKEKMTQNSSFGSYSQGIFLVGGGCLLKGMAELCAEVFHLPVHIGIPSNIKGLPREFINPKYANLTGLIKLRYDEYLKSVLKGEKADSAFSDSGLNSKFRGFLKKIF